MATRTGVGFSEQTDSAEAGREAARLAIARTGGACDMALLFATSRHDPAQLRDAVRSVIGERARLVGGYAFGVITGDRLGYNGSQVGVAVLSSDDVRFDVVSTGDLDHGERAAGLRLGAAARSVMRDGASMLLFYDSVQKPLAEGLRLNMATPLLDGIQESLGAWPTTAGLGMMGDLQFGRTHQWLDGDVAQQTAIGLMLSGNVRMDTIIMHGLRPAGGYHKITRADGPLVFEIDGKPALDRIAELLGPNAQRSPEQYPLWVTFGVNRGPKFGEFREDDYQNRLCMAVDPKHRALIMFEPDLAAGTEFQLMRRSLDFAYMRQQVAALEARLDGRTPFFAFYIDCAGRAGMLSGTTHEEAAEIQATLGARVPLLGVYSGVEIARVGDAPRPLDWTGVLCLFSAA
jgi:hypothetical protein